MLGFYKLLAVLGFYKLLAMLGLHKLLAVLGFYESSYQLQTQWIAVLTPFIPVPKLVQILQDKPTHYSTANSRLR